MSERSRMIFEIKKVGVISLDFEWSEAPQLFFMLSSNEMLLHCTRSMIVSLNCLFRRIDDDPSRSSGNTARQMHDSGSKEKKKRDEEKENSCVASLTLDHNMSDAEVVDESSGGGEEEETRI